MHAGEGLAEGWLAEAELAAVASLTSLVSVDLLVFDGEGRVLLGKRANEPARGAWFTPGGRVRKFEPLDAALRRVSEAELGAPPLARARPPLHGVYRHMYDTSRFGPEEAPWSGRRGTDYVTFAHRLTLADDYGVSAAHFIRDSQHEALRWFTAEEAVRDPDVHPFVKCYFHPHAWNRIV